MIDLSFSNHGSIWLMRADTVAGADWIEEHIPDDAQMFGSPPKVAAGSGCTMLCCS